MANTKTFHCWIKAGTVAQAEPLRIQPPAAAMTIEPQRIQPPAADESPVEKRIQPPAQDTTMGQVLRTAAPAQPVQEPASQVDTVAPAPRPDLAPLRIQPPAVAAAAIRLADMLDENKLKLQTYRLAGYALAGWWNLEAINAGQPNPIGSIPSVELRAVYGSREQALKWIASDEGQAWLGEASMHFMVSFCSEADA